VRSKLWQTDFCRVELKDVLPVRVHCLSAVANSLTWKEVVFLMVALETKAVRALVEAALTLVMGATRTAAVEKATVEAISRGVELDTTNKIKRVGPIQAMCVCLKR
jgi:hypothetical protein